MESLRRGRRRITVDANESKDLKDDEEAWQPGSMRTLEHGK